MIGFSTIHQGFPSMRLTPFRTSFGGKKLKDRVLYDDVI